MKTVFLFITFFFLPFSSLVACNSCITDTSYNDPHLATKTVHPIKKAEGCMCPCSGPRTEKNECKECNHRVPNHTRKF